MTTNEWIWFSIASNAIKTVKYKLTVPPGTKLGTYNINGDIVLSGSMINVLGANSISVATGDIMCDCPTISIGRRMEKFINGQKIPMRYIYGK